MSSGKAAIPVTLMIAWRWRGSYLASACRLMVAALFLLAAAGKIASPRAFADTIAAFQVLPHILIKPTAVYLPWLEIVAAIAFVMPTRVRAAGGLLLAVMLVVFTLSMGWVIYYGIDTECSCFGDTWSANSIGWPHILRNLLLLLMLGLGMIRPARTL